MKQKILVALGKIGDPRFQVQTLNGIKVIVPEMVSVPAGTYLIGSADDDSDADEISQFMSTMR